MAIVLMHLVFVTMAILLVISMDLFVKTTRLARAHKQIVKALLAVCIKGGLFDEFPEQEYFNCAEEVYNNISSKMS